ncbi:MAG: tRNA lysidine(34) synthetase TilS, partial [Woeseiaceae bacterium]
YRGVLYLLPERTVPPPELPGQLRPGAPLELGHGLGMLRIEAGRGPGIQPALARGGLTVRFRDGGEAIRLPAERHRRKLKKLLQDKGVLPWMRACIPLLYAGDRLIAVGDLWIAAEAYCEDGYPLRWDERPLLF